MALTKPAYNAKTGATTGKPSQEYNDYLKSLNKKSSKMAQPTSGPSGANLNPSYAPPKKKVSTTTIGNGNKQEQIPGMNAKADQLSKKGITTDQESGMSQYADGSAYEEEKQVEADTQDEDRANEAILKQMKKSVDASTKLQLDTIEQQFAIRKQQQEKINRSNEKSLQNALLMGGATGQGSSAQYAPISSQGIQQAQESYGLQQIAMLDSEENSLISEVRQAQEQGNYRILEKKLEQVEEKRQEKIKAAADLNEQIRKRNEDMIENQKEVDEENAIVDIFNEGITDTNTAVKALRDAGVSIPAKKIADTIALLSGQGGTGIIGEYNFYKSQALAKGQIPIDFNAYQDMDANRKKSIAKAGATTVSGGAGGEAGGIYDQLDYRTANAVIAQGNQFGTSDIVKKYNSIIAASNLIAGVDPNTTNPAEHQAVIYNFAKALDPDSVVREGEYATVKKYSQSLVSKYGGEIKQAIAGKGFLSPGAIKAIQEATDNRIKAYEPQYNNLKKQTADRINKIAGKDVAGTVLLDYEQGYSGNAGNDIIQQADQAKQTIDIVFDTLSADIQKKITKMYTAGMDDLTILNELKKRGIIQ